MHNNLVTNKSSRAILSLTGFRRSMSDWTTEEVQMAHFAQKNGMSVIRHMEREQYGESTSQRKFYEKTRLEAEKEEKKFKNKQVPASNFRGRGGRGGVRRAVGRTFRGGRGNRGNFGNSTNSYFCTNCSNRGHLAEFCRRGRGRGSGGPGIAN